MPNDDKKLIPYPIYNKDHLTTLNANRSDVINHYFGHKRCRVVMIEATDEQQATACRREIEKELSKENRNSRCRVPDSRGGFVICKNDCKSCPKKRSGKPHSLEMEMDNNGFEPVYNPSYDPFELVEIRLTLEAAIERIKLTHPKYAEVLSDLLDGLTIPEIAIKRNRSESTVQELISRGYDAAKEYI